MIAALAGVLSLAGCGTSIHSAGTAAPRTSASPSPSAAPTTSPTSAPASLHLPQPLDVVGLGDSVTAASHCDCSGFIADYGLMVQRRYDVPVDSVQYGVGGSTTTTMLAQLRAGGPAARRVADADVVSVTIGANDLYAARVRYDSGTCGGEADLDCFVPAVAQMGRTLKADLVMVRQLTGPRPVQILVNTYWNVFEDGAVALREDGKQYLRDSDVMTRRANVAICAAAVAEGALCVDTYAPYKGDDGHTDPTSLLASDGDHPNAAGHLVIARAMLAAGLPALLGG
jgi:lysophospholipase L1-like esterase